MKLKSLLSLLLICTLLFCLPLPVAAGTTEHVYTDGELQFTYTELNEEITIVGVEPISDKLEVTSYDLIVPSKINGIPVTAIGDSFPGFFSEWIYFDNVVIPEGVTHIGDYVFSHSSLLSNFSYSSLSLPSTLVSIGKHSFSTYNTTSETITIPQNVSTIGVGSFIGKSNLQVSPQNTAYHIDGNCLIETASGKVVAAFVLSDEWPLPNDGSIREIGDYAFDLVWQRFEGNLVLPEGITHIGKQAFVSMNMKSVTLPSTLLSIDEKAFNKCYSLSNVYYNGTTNDWEKMSIGSGNTVFDTYEHIHFLQNCETHTYTAESGTTCTVCGYVDTTPPTTTEAPTTTMPTTTTTKVPTTTTTTKAPSTTKSTTTTKATTTTTTTKTPTTTVTDVVTTTVDVTTTDATTVTTTDVAATTTADVAAVATTTTVTTTTATTAASTTPKGQFPWWVLLIAIPVAAAAGVGVTIVVLKKKTPPVE